MSQSSQPGLFAPKPAPPAPQTSPTAPESEAEEAPQPLAERMRPQALNEVVGQRHLVGERGALARAIRSDRLGSMILWGPPGSGKTTLARLVASHTRARFVSFSAVLSGTRDLKDLIQRIRHARSARTVLFVDEIHRWNRAQQDALLPHVESGLITLIGATTENPSFQVNRALLSRARVLVLKPLSDRDLVALLQRALSDPRGFAGAGPTLDDETLLWAAQGAEGDARKALGLLEEMVEVCQQMDWQSPSMQELQPQLSRRQVAHDRAGDSHYQLASALIKSMRASDPDAAIYYLVRLLEGGEDPMFVARRLSIFAAEDVGLADPRALQVAVAAQQATHLIGMPEALYPLSEATLYLATAPKSDTVKRAWYAAKAVVEKRGALPIPMKLRNAPTTLLRELGHGAGYRNPHHTPHGYTGETCLPEALVGTRFFAPTGRGYERHLGERMSWLQERVSGRSPRPAAPGSPSPGSDRETAPSAPPPAPDAD